MLFKNNKNYLYNKTMNCPNDDQNFTLLLNKLFKKQVTPEDRKKLFYLVCIPLRLLLIILLFIYSSNQYVQYLFVFLSLFACYNLYTSTVTTQWWSKKYQLLMSVLMVVCGSLVIYGKLPPKILAVLFCISWLGGLLQSLTINFC